MKNRRLYFAHLADIEARLGLDPGEEIVALTVDHASGTLVIATNAQEADGWLAPGQAPPPRQLRPHPRPEPRRVRDAPQA